MGIEILSFTIKDVYDDVQYLASLGKAQTAVVKRDADVGVAQANRDAGIREAECEKSAMDVKYSMDTKIEDNTRLFKLQKAQFDQEVNTAKAEAALAYELQAAKIKQKIRNEEIQIEVVERRKQIEVEQQEILRREEELKAMVLGLAEATAIGDVGKADAERMLAKAKVYKQYGDAAIMALVLEALPKIAAEVSAPLAKTDEIVLVGDSGATGEVARLAGGIPPALKTLTGLDLSQAHIVRIAPNGFYPHRTHRIISNAYMRCVLMTSYGMRTIRARGQTHTTASTNPHRTDRIISKAYKRCVLMTSYGMRTMRAYGRLP
ncbi:hypothetical protein SFRURICE_009380 [Spodoptera frugiperda]|nr:hypothetical protein SFRURICE_009380 [Spodoptera frugiperda]